VVPLVLDSIQVSCTARQLGGRSGKSFFPLTHFLWKSGFDRNCKVLSGNTFRQDMQAENNFVEWALTPFRETLELRVSDEAAAPQ